MLYIYITLGIILAVFTYSCIVIAMQKVFSKLTNMDDDSAFFASMFWPVSWIFLSAWLITNRIVNRISSKKKEKISKYNQTDIPKGDITSLKEYRKLGNIHADLTNKILKYEKSHNVPVMERIANGKK